MSTRDDPLTKHPAPPDRVFYATGVLLDAEDFGAEQTYHRGRLARALAGVHGSGTVAGLEIVWTPASDSAEERLEVTAGMAIDRLGRIIEVPRDACIRLDRWFEAQDDSALTKGFKENVTRGVEDGIPTTGVVVDVFMRFVACERGKTPAFQSGPFDALDAVQPSRLRDGYEVTLVIREEDDPQLPDTSWPDLGADGDPATRRRAFQDALLSWQVDTNSWTKAGPAPLREHAAGQDTTALFLGRLVLPATRSARASRPTRSPGAPVKVSNHSRAFVYGAAALAKWIGLRE